MDNGGVERGARWRERGKPETGKNLKEREENNSKHAVSEISYVTTHSAQLTKCDTATNCIFLLDVDPSNQDQNACRTSAQFAKSIVKHLTSLIPPGVGYNVSLAKHKVSVPCAAHCSDSGTIHHNVQILLASDIQICDSMLKRESCRWLFYCFIG